MFTKHELAAYFQNVLFVLVFWVFIQRISWITSEKHESSKNALYLYDT